MEQLYRVWYLKLYRLYRLYRLNIYICIYIYFFCPNSWSPYQHVTIASLAKTYSNAVYTKHTVLLLHRAD